MIWPSYPPGGYSLPGNFGGTMVPAVSTAREFGYELCVDLEAPEGHLFRKVGSIIEARDEFYRYGEGPWVRIDMYARHLIGKVVTIIMFPIVYQDPNYVPTRWSCRHPRDPHETHCLVCAAVWPWKKRVED